MELSDKCLSFSSSVDLGFDQQSHFLLGSAKRGLRQGDYFCGEEGEDGVLGYQSGEGETRACRHDRGPSEISYADPVLNKVTVKTEFKLTMISIVML